MRNGNPLFLSIKYEKLLDFCYKCGLLTHMEKKCIKITNVKFGPGLRAQAGARD